uniref:Small ribosomal subunit protein uS3c n=1 Tax=Dipterosiphonia australica TaxID=2007208 RepID=A0A1Z1MM80_9FLOR|nr:ribosomal protein S3 [Dipterosiphonia australica]ARW66874.1 ribosomal protein S3 [Dipterosiphonia australica]
MGQKTHPLGFRIGITELHRSSWFSKMRVYPIFIEEDYKIRNFIEKKLYKAHIARVQIDRKVDQIEIHIHTARPGIILGKSGSGINTIRNEIITTLTKSNKVRINIIEINEPDREAILIGQWIAQQLEKRVAFRRAIRQSIQKANKANINGIKIQIAGRLNGAEIARTEWVREGRVPLQTLRANIDYAYTRAHTIYGILGIKIWLFKDENIKT